MNESTPAVASGPQPNQTSGQSTCVCGWKRTCATLRQSVAAIWILCSTAVFGCGGPKDEGRCRSPQAIAQQAIVGGTDEFEALSDSDLEGAIGFARIDARPEAGYHIERWCTVVRVGHDRVLSAAHCFRDAYAVSLGFREAVEEDTGGCLTEFTFAANSLKIHPALDLAVVYFAGPSADPVLELSQREPDPGDSVVIAGYGMTEASDSGRRQFLEAEVLSANAGAVRVEAPGAAGACVGDSGGPLLWQGDSKHYSVAGILHGGSASCQGIDEFTPVAADIDWVLGESPAQGDTAM